MTVKALLQKKNREINAVRRDIRFPSPVTLDALERVFADCCDFEMRRILVGGGPQTAAVCFIDGLVSGETVAEEILRPLTSAGRFGREQGEKELIEKLTGGMVYVHSARKRTDLNDLIADLLNGFCAVVFDRERAAVTFEVRSKEKRTVDQPKEEKVVKGSKDAFIEALKTNTTLVRQKLRNPRLKVRQTILGRQTRTTAAVVYIEGFTNREIVDEVTRRLKAIETDAVLTAASIEEFLADDPITPFPQLINTERPDKFCMNILEGRVGLLVDGLPMGFLAPGTFSQFLKGPEDNANHFLIGSALILLRYAAMMITLLFPAFYTAVAMYHQEMIPIKLIESIIESKQSVPFPTAMEVIGMLIIFELLQEAGLRLPNPVGETVSIIGALIVGQSAVEAKVVSPVVVIVVALTGIAGYAIPDQDMSAALRICRFLLTVAAIAAGMFGLAVGFAMVVYHLCSLESYGVPYMTPFAGNEGKHILRAVTRSPMPASAAREPALQTGEDGDEAR